MKNAKKWDKKVICRSLGRRKDEVEHTGFGDSDSALWTLKVNTSHSTLVPTHRVQDKGGAFSKLQTSGPHDV